MAFGIEHCLWPFLKYTKPQVQKVQIFYGEMFLQF